MEDNPADVAIKTHALDSYRYTHAIHLVRSPFDVLDSFDDAGNGCLAGSGGTVR